MIDEERENSNIFYRYNDLRDSIKEKILQNQKFLKYLKYTDANPLGHEDISIDEAWDMVGEKKKNSSTGEETGGYIFFQPRTEGTSEDTRNMFVMSMRLKVRDTNSPIADVYVYFNVLIRYENYELIDGSARVFDILGSLYEDFGNTDGEWLGRMKLIGGDDITAPNKYHGYSAVLKISDFLGNWVD